MQVVARHVLIALPTRHLVFGIPYVDGAYEATLHFAQQHIILFAFNQPPRLPPTWTLEGGDGIARAARHEPNRLKALPPPGLSPNPVHPPRRVGLRVLLSGSLSHLQWFGRGPHENYPDRKASAAVRRYTSAVSQQLTPYIRPGECGAKVDIRWLEVSGGVGSGSTAVSSRRPAVMFAAVAQRAGEREGNGGGTESALPAKNGGDRLSGSKPSFAFSALPHLAEDLAEQRHPEALAPRSVTVVSLDHQLMGAGGDDSWSACVHDEFLVRPGRFCFGFAMAPYWRNNAGGDGGDGGGEGEGGGAAALDGDRDQAAECWRGLKALSMGD